MDVPGWDRSRRGCSLSSGSYLVETSIGIPDGSSGECGAWSTDRLKISHDARVLVDTLLEEWCHGDSGVVSEVTVSGASGDAQVKMLSKDDYYWAGVRAAAPCPTDFQNFINAFQESPRFQIAHSSDPLTYVDERARSDTDKAPLRTEIPWADLARYPAIRFPTYDEQRTTSLSRSFWSPQMDIRTVRLGNDATGTETRFNFARSSQCWELIGVEVR
jgi:hypothetical protein